MISGQPARYVQPPKTKYPVMISIIDDFTGHMILIWLIIMAINIIELFAHDMGIHRAFIQTMMLIKLGAVAIVATHCVFLTCCTIQVVRDSQ